MAFFSSRLSIFICLIGAIFAQSDDNDNDCMSSNRIEELVLKNYNKKKIPKGGLDVGVDLWLKNIQSPSAITGDLDSHLYLGAIWTDAALAYSDLNPCKDEITLDDPSKLLDVRLAFISAKQSKITASPTNNIFILWYSNGTVWFNYGMSVLATCDIDLRQFPMDLSVCSMTLGSYRYSTEEVRLHWQNPVVVLPKSLNTPGFQLTNITTSKKVMQYPAGEFDELTATYKFRRVGAWYMKHAYLPACVMLFCVWIGFFFRTSSVLLRAMLCMTGIVVIGYLWFTMASALPTVAYVTKFDLWMGACVTLCVLALLENAIAYHCGKLCRSKREKDYDVGANYQNHDEAHRLVRDEPDFYGPDKNSTGCFASMKNNFVDLIAIILFPGLFVAFLFVYLLIL